MTQIVNDYEPLLLRFHLPLKRDGYSVIGTDGSAELVLMPSGEILAVAASETRRDVFVNSSIEQLSKCIRAHEIYARNVVSVVNEVSQFAIIEQFASTIDAIDPKVLIAPENWWATIIEQMRDGLL